MRSALPSDTGEDSGSTGSLSDAGSCSVPPDAATPASEAKEGWGIAYKSATVRASFPLLLATALPHHPTRLPSTRYPLTSPCFVLRADPLRSLAPPRSPLTPSPPLPFVPRLQLLPVGGYVR